MMHNIQRERELMPHVDEIAEDCEGDQWLRENSFTQLWISEEKRNDAENDESLICSYLT